MIETIPGTITDSGTIKTNLTGETAKAEMTGALAGLEAQAAPSALEGDPPRA